MTLYDADIADLAREAVDRKDPDLDIHIDPQGRDDPYRLGTQAWTVRAGGRASYLRSDLTRREALEKLVADLTS